MKKWEYMVQIQRSLETVNGQLKNYGEKGWELVHVGEKLGSPVLFMKRSLEED